MNRHTRTAADRGVSPVIGVILMVAITVIIATMVGSVFLDYAGQISDQPPQAAFEYDFDDDDNVTITHVSGDRIDSATIRITVGGEEAFPDADSDFATTGWDDSIRAGEPIEIEDSDADSGDTIRIIWENPSGGSANTLDTRDWQ